MPKRISPGLIAAIVLLAIGGVCLLAALLWGLTTSAKENIGGFLARRRKRRAREDRLEAEGKESEKDRRNDELQYEECP